MAASTTPTQATLLVRDTAGLTPRVTAVNADEGVHAAVSDAARLVHANVSEVELNRTVTAAVAQLAYLDTDTRGIVCNAFAALAALPADQRDSYLDSLVVGRQS